MKVEAQMIPKVPEEEQILSVDHGDYKYLQGSIPADKRMHEGAAHYGYSWCEVNLKEDLLEEQYDSLNYVLLMMLRITSLGQDIPDYLMKVFLRLREIFEEAIGLIDKMVPEFEGPTSAEWIEAHR